MQHQPTALIMQALIPSSMSKGMQSQQLPDRDQSVEEGNFAMAVL